MTIAKEQLPKILEAALMASGQPLSIDQMLSLFLDDQQPSRDEIREALNEIADSCENRGVELKQVSSGYRFQARQDYAQWIARLWEEKPPRYSRALLETLVLIAYRQPITRSEIEDVRGVSVSTHIIKTLLEREWVRVVGHRDVPGKPALYATTRQFLDYFNMKSLEELPTLQEIRDLDKINAELDLNEPGAQAQPEQDAAIQTQQPDTVDATDQDATDQDAADQDVSGDTQQGLADTAVDNPQSPAVESAENDIADAEAVAGASQSEDENAITAVADEDDESAVEPTETRAGAEEAQTEDEEDSEEMLYADSHDDAPDGEAMDDKYAGTSATQVIREPNEARSAISDGTDTHNALKT